MKHLSTIAFIFGILFLNQCFAQTGWNRSFGDISADYGYCSVSDNTGGVIVGGGFNGQVNFGVDLSENSTELNPYLVKYDSLGNGLWIKRWESVFYSYIYSCCSDGVNTYVLGGFNDQIDLIPGPGIDTTTQGVNGIFISKIDGNGNWVWSKAIEVPQAGILTRTISFSGNGRLKVTGTFSGTVDFDPSASVFELSTSALDHEAVFILDLNTDGNFNWVRQLSEVMSGFVDPQGGAADEQGNVYVTGHFDQDVDFDPGSGNTTIASSSQDFFLLKLNNDGDFIWVKSLTNAKGWDVKVDHNNDVIVTGDFSSMADFDFGLGNASLAPTDSRDAFILKIDSSGTFIWVNALTGDGDQAGKYLSIDQNNEIANVGRYSFDLDINQGSYSFSSPASSTNDVYYLKMDSAGTFMNTYLQEGSGVATVFSVSSSQYGGDYMIGHYMDQVDLDMNAPVNNFSSNGVYDIYVVKIGEVDYSGVGLTELSKSTLNFYPNPANNLIQLAITESVNYRIADAFGQIQSSGNTSGEINLESLSSGMYVVELASGQKARFIKE